MNDYVVLMHDDAPRNGEPNDAGDWGGYIAKLQKEGRFDGGSEIGRGACVRKSGEPAEISAQLVGYIRVRAATIEEGRSLLEGNSAFDAGGTVEMRDLPRSE